MKILKKTWLSLTILLVLGGILAVGSAWGESADDILNNVTAINVASLEQINTSISMGDLSGLVQPGSSIAGNFTGSSQSALPTPQVGLDGNTTNLGGVSQVSSRLGGPSQGISSFTPAMMTTLGVGSNLPGVAVGR